MKKLSPHFWYSKSQRNGVFFLVLLIIGFQVVIASYDVDFEDEVSMERQQQLAELRAEIDSLKKARLNEEVFKIYPFNPNYMSDFKGYQLGMSTEEIDRLFQFRETGRFVNSAEAFQRVTKISDSLLDKMKPYFKFPRWANSKKNHTNRKKNKIQPATVDINLASKEDLKLIAGIGEKRAETILKYRKRIQGFTYKDQMNEVWGLDATIVENIWKVFAIVKKPEIQKLNINTASFKEVLRIPYINYELCKAIFDYRDLVAEIQSLTELQRIEGLSKNKYDRIVLYLLAE
ncbi:MAG: hypothetical protein CMB99_07100 [Flavobacteriaceae bacterium]|nr:hypothetical protein [Flavobacteriaceae bacterium]|tara:strand:- start:3115 stop:3981 length:867 start_codon:yes stop_codon:yes gene_type:complete